jgi:hypothetical protein
VIPILRDHDASKVIGVADTDGGRITIKFSQDLRITKSMFFEIFGNAGVIVTDADGDNEEEKIIRKAEIIEFSLPALSKSVQESALESAVRCLVDVARKTTALCEDCQSLEECDGYCRRNGDKALADALDAVEQLLP